MSKTHVIDGVTYVEVKREAEVGDSVLIVKAHLAYDKYRDGDVINVQRSFNDGVENDFLKAKCNDTGFIAISEYVVVEPIEDEGSPDVTDILANLARRVSSLEQQLRDTQRNLETFAEQTESNSEDIRTLDERTQSKSGTKLLAEAFDALARYERSAGR